MRMNMFSTYKGLKKEVYLLSLARTINSMGDFVFSLITLYMTIQLGMSENVAGIYVSIAALVSSPGVLVGGYLSDLMGKKRIILFGQIMSALLVLGCLLFMETLTVGYILILAMFFISITRPAYNSMIIDLTAGEAEQKTAFSLMYLGANLGIAIGPLIAGFFMKDHMDWVFWGIGVISLCSSVLIAKFVKPPARARDERKGRETGVHVRPDESFFRTLLQKPLVLSFICISFLNYFIYMQSSFSVPLQLNHSFADSGPSYYGFVMTANAVCVILLTTVIASLTRKITPSRLVAAGALFYAFGFGSMYFSIHLSVVLLATLLWTVGEILVQTNINVYIAARVPDTHQGRFNGLLLFVGCLGYSLSPYLTGLFIKHYSIVTVWPSIFIIGLLYAVLMAILQTVEKRRNFRSEEKNITA